jgi:hypothetical protein
MKTYESDIAWSNKFLVAEAAAEVDAFFMGYIKRFQCIHGLQVLIHVLPLSSGHGSLRGSRWRRKAWRSSSFRTFDFILVPALVSLGGFILRSRFSW